MRSRTARVIERNPVLKNHNPKTKMMMMMMMMMMMTMMRMMRMIRMMTISQHLGGRGQKKEYLYLSKKKSSGKAHSRE